MQTCQPVGTSSASLMCFNENPARTCGGQVVSEYQLATDRWHGDMCLAAALQCGFVLLCVSHVHVTWHLCTAALLAAVPVWYVSPGCSY